MAETSRVYVKSRNGGRREDDRHLLDQIFRHSQVSQVGRIIMSEMNLEDLLDLIMAQTVQILSARRCTVFLYDDHTDELWSMVATGMERNKIRIPSDAGIAGWVFKHREPIIINDAYHDPRFFSGIDKETGFRTQNILCIPLINRWDTCIGVLQTLNKISGHFSDKDKDLLSSISHYISIALENSKLYEDLKSINDARKKVIDHLAHELRTPVAIIDAGLEQITRKLPENSTANINRTLDRCKRNLKRLLGIQEKITDILNYRFTEDRQMITRLVETVFSLTEEIEEENGAAHRDLLQSFHRRLETAYRTDEYHPGTFGFSDFLHEVCDHSVIAMGERELEIARNFPSDLLVETDRTMLGKVCSGLLKNAIEATPDQGKIRIGLERLDGNIHIEFQDWGVGITPGKSEEYF